MKKILSLMAAFLLFLAACKKDNKEDEHNHGGNTSTEATVEVHMDLVTDSIQNKLELNRYYALGDDSVSFAEVRYWLSNVEFILEDGSVWKEKASYRLMETTSSTEREEFAVKLPAGKYKGIRFALGVDSNRNSSIDSISGELDVTKGMSWTWNTGYIFMKVDGGFYNAALDDKGPWNYHVGTNANYRVLEFMFDHHSIELADKGTAKIHFAVKLLDFFRKPNVMSLRDNPSLMVGPANLTIKASENYAAAIELDHVH